LFVPDSPPDPSSGNLAPEKAVFGRIHEVVPQRPGATTPVPPAGFESSSFSIIDESDQMRMIRRLMPPDDGAEAPGRALRPPPPPGIFSFGYSFDRVVYGPPLAGIFPFHRVVQNATSFLAKPSLSFVMNSGDGSRNVHIM